MAGRIRTSGPPLLDLQKARSMGQGEDMEASCGVSGPQQQWGHRYSRAMLAKLAVPLRRYKMATLHWIGNVVTLSSPMNQMPGHRTRSATHAGSTEGLRSAALFSVLWGRETDLGSWPKSQGSR